MAGAPLDPNGLFQGFYPWTDLSKWGAFGPAIQSTLGLLRGPNVPAQAGTQAATQAADTAASNYQSTVQGGQRNLASRGLVGSGGSQDVIGGALDTLSGSLAGGVATGSNITQQMMNQLRQMVLGQLNSISTTQNRGQAGISSANLGLQGANQQGDALRAELFGDIGGLGAGLLTSFFSPKYAPLAEFGGRLLGAGIGY